jgi:hypothetical protein
MLDIGNLAKVTPKKAIPLSQLCNLSDDAKLVLKAELSVIEYFTLLMGKELYIDVVKLLAQGLPIREGIWWSYCCAIEAEQDKANEDVLNTLQVVKHWIYQPNETYRRAAEVAAKKLEFKTPSSWVATAVFWSGGSVAPSDSPDVYIPEEHIGKAIAGAIMLACALDQNDNIQANYKRYLSRGFDIADGGNGEI